MPPRPAASRKHCISTNLRQISLHPHPTTIMPNLADVVTVRWVLAGLAVVFLICGTGLLWAAEDQ